MKGSHAGGIAFVVILLVVMTALIGWVGNIVQIVHHLADPITGFFILRCVGIIIGPLGAVIGYF